MTTTASERPSGIQELVDERSVIVCAGTGGVGKTSCAAALAVTAARRGRRAVVVTIDPARRLAETLALPELADVAHDVPRDRWDPTGLAPPGGRLAAVMLDARSTFDALIAEHAADPDQAERILANRFYRNVAGALSGTQEYMAAEKLYELHESGAYDLVVVDTPPTRHALDFLDAPGRLTRLLDHRLFRMLMAPSVRVTGGAMRVARSTVGAVIGREAVDDVVTFFRAFAGMEVGFRERAHGVTRLLADPGTAFVVITSPRDDAVSEAELFAQRLNARGLRVSALVVNRVHPRYELAHGGADAAQPAWRDRAVELGLRAEELPIGTTRAPLARLSARYDYVAAANTLGQRERERLDRANEQIAAPATAWIPSFAHDVVDFAALDALASHLLG